MKVYALIRVWSGDDGPCETILKLRWARHVAENEAKEFNEAVDARMNKDIAATGFMSYGDLCTQYIVREMEVSN